MTFQILCVFRGLCGKRMPLGRIEGCRSGGRWWLLLGGLSLLPALLACDGQPALLSTPTVPTSSPTAPVVSPTPDIPAVDLTLAEGDVTVAPLPLRAGFPFTITAAIHNNSPLPATDVPVMVYISAAQEQIGFTPFLQVFTVTLPATRSLPLTVPVHWNFAGGKHQLWMQVNRLPHAWQSRTPIWPEARIEDNAVRLELMIEPFDAYTSNLCPGRVDVEVGPADLGLEPDARRVWVRVHNVGNQAVYNLPVVVIGAQLTGMAYTPIIPPCGGTAQVAVSLERPPQRDELLTVQVNPVEWSGALPEDDFDNNRATLAVSLASGTVLPPGDRLAEYDFSLDPTDIELPEPWLALITVHNLGTRDAAMVPIRIENQAGRKLTDAIPLVRGNGLGVAAFRIGYLWTRGGTLTFTVNPADAKGAYPEVNRDNNVAPFALP